MTDDFGAFNPFDEVENNSAEKEKTEDSSAKQEVVEQKPMPEVSFEETHQQEVEHDDQERLEEIENEYKELDEEILDIEEGEDTMWLIQKVGIGILKIAGVIGIVIFLFWSIWGGDNDKPKKNVSVDKKVEKVEKQKEITKKVSSIKSREKDTKKKEVEVIEKTKNSEGFWSKLFGGGDKKEISPAAENPAKKEKIVPPVSDEEIKELEKENRSSSAHSATVQLMAWNYWLEKDRLLGKKNTPGEVALWTKDAESLFDIPFVEQVKGNNDIEREKKVNSLISNTENLLKKAENIQNKLVTEIVEFSAKEKQYTQEAIEYERLFLEAMNKSNPSGIDQFLENKIVAEKKQTENGIEAESRRILSEKIDSYAQVIVNLREYLVANRKALIKDVQVVAFPEDPFNRIIPLETWESLKHSAS